MAKVTHPNSYSTVVAIGKAEIDRVDIVTLNQPRETLSAWYNRQTVKPDYLINGGYFAMSNGTPVFNLKDEGEIKSANTSYKWGMGVLPDGSLSYGALSDKYKDFISGYPCLVDNKQTCSLSYAKEIAGSNPRSVIGYNGDTLFLIAVDGRRLGRPGMKMFELAEFAKKVGCDYAINLDGGGSTRLMRDAEVLNSPTENRAVDNAIAVYLKKEVKQMPTVYISPSTQEDNKGKGAYGTEEQRMNDIADVLCTRLKAYGIKTLRNTPTMTLAQITETSNIAQVDYHIAIHSNAGGARGTEVLVYALGGKAEQLARNVYTELSSITPTTDRDVKLAPSLWELKATTAPAILIEVEFHDSTEGAEWIMKNISNIAEAILKGILKQLGIPFIQSDVPSESGPKGPKGEQGEPSVSSRWYAKAQEYVIEKKLSDGTRPNDTATRAEIWEMLYRLSK